MTHSSTLNPAYEVVLGPPVIRTVLSLGPAERKELAAALRTELVNGPNSDMEYTFDSAVQAYSKTDAGQGEMIYTATPLSFAGYTAVHRRLTKEELRRLRREQGRATASTGLYVIDILRAESAFARTVPRRV